MPVFEYQAINQQQKQVSGLIESDHIKSARTQLKEQHLTILNIALASPNSTVAI
jgi:type II secretory pathway component PulF